jgi:hypothetical protein
LSQLRCDVSPRRFCVSSKAIVARHLEIQRMADDLRETLCTSIAAFFEKQNAVGINGATFAQSACFLGMLRTGVDASVTLEASNGDQRASRDAEERHLLAGSRQSKKQQGAGRLNRAILVVLGQTGLVLHGNWQVGIAKLLHRVTMRSAL